MKFCNHVLVSGLVGIVGWLAGVSSVGFAQQMQYPLAVAVSEDGATYVADRGVLGKGRPTIWKVTSGKVEVYFEGTPQFRTPLNCPLCVAIDRDGKLLVGDSAMREVYRFDDAGKPQPLTQGGIGIPRAIVVMASGDLMVADQELHVIWKVPAAGGKPEKFVAVPGLISACVDQAGDLWVTSAQKHLRHITPDGKVENVLTESPMQFPQGIAVDEAKTLYIADNYAKAIWKIPSGAAPVKLAEGAPLVGPTGVAWVQGKLIVADPQAKALFEIDADGKVTQVTAGS